MSKRVNLLILLMVVMVMVSCGSEQVVETEEIRDVSTVDSKVDNKEEVESKLIDYISGVAQPEYFTINSGDYITGCEVNNIYWFNNSIYLQANKYMYRFQLDSSNNIVSYVKYTLDF